jgi:hypothetical protein
VFTLWVKYRNDEGALIQCRLSPYNVLKTERNRFVTTGIVVKVGVSSNTTPKKGGMIIYSEGIVGFLQSVLVP